jgi:nitroreductase
LPEAGSLKLVAQKLMGWRLQPKVSDPKQVGQSWQPKTDEPKLSEAGSSDVEREGMGKIVDIGQAIEARHSVRQYTDQPIPYELAAELRSFIADCNSQSGLSMQLKLGENRGFSGLRSLVLKNAENYLAIVGNNDEHLDELGGYWGEKVVLKATQLGLGSCWFAMGAKKDAIDIQPGERLLLVVALGYAAKAGKPHVSKPLEDLYLVEGGGEAPQWFLAGMRAAQLAPTARNQQKFRFTLVQGHDDLVRAESLGGAFSMVDLGIVKCHFELGASARSFAWA